MLLFTWIITFIAFLLPSDPVNMNIPVNISWMYHVHFCRSQVFPSWEQERRWSRLWWLCAKTSDWERSSSRPTTTQVNQRYVSLKHYNLYKYSIKYKIIRNKYFLAGVSVNVLSLKVPQAYITDNSILDLEISHILAVVGMFHFVWRAVSKARWNFTAPV